VHCPVSDLPPPLSKARSVKSRCNVGPAVAKNPVALMATSSIDGTGKLARILIVEDEYFVAIGLEESLQEAGYEVVGIAVSVAQAIRLGGELKPDLAIMDIRLLGSGDGIDAAIELRTKFGIPSLFASAHSDSHTRERAAKALPVGWLVKPYSNRLAVETVRQILNK
jgi:DNA-binding NarL/FixJ family response regulator